MYRYLKATLILMVLVGLASCARAPAVKKAADVKAGQKTDQKKVRIVRDNLTIGLLGIPFDTFLSHVAFDEVRKMEGCCWGVKRKGQLMIVLYDKKGLSDRIVRNFEIVSPAVTLNYNLRVGMTIDSLLTIYPDIELQIDENDDQIEYFSPPVLSSHKPDGSLDTVVVLEVESRSGNPLSINNQYPTTHFHREGHISKISVFKW